MRVRIAAVSFILQGLDGAKGDKVSLPFWVFFECLNTRGGTDGNQAHTDTHSRWHTDAHTALTARIEYQQR